VDFIDADTLVFDAAEFDVFGLYTVTWRVRHPGRSPAASGRNAGPPGV
jgi:hypothetical protein